MRRSLTALCLLLAAAPAFATYISLNSSLSARIQGNKLKIDLQAVNKGDESAFNVQPEIRAAGRTLTGSKISELPVGAALQKTFTCPLPPGLPGSYPLALTMHYTDANQYHFSALTARTFVKGEEPLPPLYGRGRPITFWQAGKLRFTLKNSGDRPLQATLTLIAPRELSVTAGSRELALAPQREEEAVFALKNFSALSGSTYQLYLVCEFDDGGRHHTVIFPGTVRIVERKEVLGFSYTTLGVVLAGLVAFFVAAQFLKRS